VTPDEQCFSRCWERTSLDDDTVVDESRSDDRDLLVAWDVGTPESRRPAEVAGSAQASFADVLGP
jgi:hypothetical protein